MYPARFGRYAKNTAQLIQRADVRAIGVSEKLRRPSELFAYADGAYVSSLDELCCVFGVSPESCRIHLSCKDCSRRGMEFGSSIPLSSSVRRGDLVADSVHTPWSEGAVSSAI